MGSDIPDGNEKAADELDAPQSPALHPAYASLELPDDLPEVSLPLAPAENLWSQPMTAPPITRILRTNVPLAVTSQSFAPTVDPKTPCRDAATDSPTDRESSPTVRDALPENVMERERDRGMQPRSSTNDETAQDAASMEMSNDLPEVAAVETIDVETRLPIPGRISAVMCAAFMFVAALSILFATYIGYSIHSYYLHLGELGLAYKVLFCTAMAAILISMTVFVGQQIRRYRTLPSVERFRHAVTSQASVDERRRALASLGVWLSGLERAGRIRPSERLAILHKVQNLDDVAACQRALSPILMTMDQRARAIIEAEARAVGMLSALSPYAFVDAICVLWRNSRMVVKIAEAYGARPSLFGSAWLIARVVGNVAFGALSQDAVDWYYQTFGVKVAGIVGDAVSGTGQAMMKGGAVVATVEPFTGLGLGFLGTLAAGAGGAVGAAAREFSGPVLQGFLAGVLTLRVGLAAQNQCRLLLMNEAHQRERIATLLSTLYGFLRTSSSRKSATNSQIENASN